MSIKAIFPEGVTAITVNGLYQWDYGRTLEIYDASLPALVEVHFASAGMDEAVVRVCAVVDGVVDAVIPARCAEQTAPVLVWVYVVGDTSGKTVKTITLPIIARTKPQPGASVPDDISDKYTEAVGAINAAKEAAVGEIEGLTGSLFPYPSANTSKRLTNGGYYGIYINNPSETVAKYYNFGVLYWMSGRNFVSTSIQMKDGYITLRLTSNGQIQVWENEAGVEAVDVTDRYNIYTAKLGG